MMFKDQYIGAVTTGGHTIIQRYTRGAEVSGLRMGPCLRIANGTGAQAIRTPHVCELGLARCASTGRHETQKVGT